MFIRSAEISDLKSIKWLEDASFKENERITKEAFEKFLNTFSSEIWLVCDEENVVAQILAQTTNERDLDDEMYAGVKFYDKNGVWLMIVSLAVSPKYRKQGLAKILLEKVKNHAKNSKKFGVVLTCNTSLVKFYEKFGFKNEGICKSNFGGENWHQMRWICE